VNYVVPVKNPNVQSFVLAMITGIPALWTTAAQTVRSVMATLPMDVGG
jgi:hypothetical protein